MKSVSFGITLFILFMALAFGPASAAVPPPVPDAPILSPVEIWSLDGDLTDEGYCRTFASYEKFMTLTLVGDEEGVKRLEVDLGPVAKDRKLENFIISIVPTYNSTFDKPYTKNSVVMFDVNNDKGFLDALGNGALLYIKFGDVAYAFSLSGVHTAINALMRCDQDDLSDIARAQVNPVKQMDKPRRSFVINPYPLEEAEGKMKAMPGRMIIEAGKMEDRDPRFLPRGRPATMPGHNLPEPIMIRRGEKLPENYEDITVSALTMKQDTPVMPAPDLPPPGGLVAPVPPMHPNMVDAFGAPVPIAGGPVPQKDPEIAALRKEVESLKKEIESKSSSAPSGARPERVQSQQNGQDFAAANNSPMTIVPQNTARPSSVGNMEGFYAGQIPEDNLQEPDDIAIASVPAEPPSPQAMQQRPNTQWFAQNKESLRDVLSRWSIYSGVRMLWNNNEEFDVKRDLAIKGSYEAAVSQILDQYINLSDKTGEQITPRPVGEIFIDPATSQRVLIVRVLEPEKKNNS